MSLRFKVDENLPIEVAAILSAAGHDAKTIPEQRMSGKPDRAVAEVCQQEQRVLVTLDMDFADIRAYPPAEYSGIVVLRLSRVDKHRILRVVQRLVPTLGTEPVDGKLWIVEEANVRVRD